MSHITIGTARQTKVYQGWLPRILFLPYLPRPIFVMCAYGFKIVRLV